MGFYKINALFLLIVVKNALISQFLCHFADATGLFLRFHNLTGLLLTR